MTTHWNTLEIYILRMLIISFPLEVCFSNASSPSISACLFASRISMDVLCIISAISRSRRVFLNGRRLTRNLRNLGGPSFTRVGRRLLRQKTIVNINGLPKPRHTFIIMISSNMGGIHTSAALQQCCTDGGLNFQLMNQWSIPVHFGRSIRELFS